MPSTFSVPVRSFFPFLPSSSRTDQGSHQAFFWVMMTSAGMRIPILAVDFCLRLDIHEFSHVGQVLKCTRDHRGQDGLV